MGMSNATDPQTILENSRVLFNREKVAATVQKMADEINAYYGDQPVILISVLTGAIIPAAWLITKLKMPVQMDFVHATRYAGQTEGGEIEFRVPPRLNIEGHDVLIIDDIYDIGLTLQMIEKYCESRGARTVNSAVLVRKVHDRETTAKRPEFVGMEVKDKYIFGCGMDAYEHWRHLDEIWALEEG
jgi:hypoxanthine phosphoribosyltransferase